MKPVEIVGVIFGIASVLAVGFFIGLIGDSLGVSSYGYDQFSGEDHSTTFGLATMAIGLMIGWRVGALFFKVKYTKKDNIDFLIWLVGIVFVMTVSAITYKLTKGLSGDAIWAVRGFIDLLSIAIAWFVLKEIKWKIQER